MSTLTPDQAYAAMYNLLDRIHQRTKSGDVDRILMGMSLLPDGLPIDAVIAGDWQEAVQFALKGGKSGSWAFGPQE
jgi:hypothetical protein